jgi:O-antigen/teichoic acid export membrane protein
MTSLKKLAIRGAAWTVMGYGVSVLLRFGGNLILTRLLVPEFFGLMSIVYTLKTGLELFSDVGIIHSIIRNPRGDDPVFLNTAWTLQVIRGFFLWLMSLVITVPAAQLYDDSRLLWLIPLIGLASIFDGFRSTAECLINRRLEMAKLNLFELGTQLFSLIVLVVWCYFSPTIWALAIGSLSGSFLHMILSHFLAKDYRVRFAWERESLKELLSFGRWIFISTALMFAAEQADRLILGKLVSFTVLGVYTIAFTFSVMPRDVIKHVGSRVIFPVMSQQSDLPRAEMRSKILEQRKLVLFGSAMLVASMTAFGDRVVSLLYDYRYVEATWMLPILCFGIWFAVLLNTISPALLALGKPLYWAQSNFVRLIFIAIGMPLGYSLMGLPGAIIVISLSDFLPYLAILWGLKREQLSCVAQDIQATVFYFFVLALLVGLRYALGFGLPIQTLLERS